MDLKRKHGHITPELREMAIRALREGGVTQAQLAEEIGVSTKTLQRWMQAADLEENNERVISLVFAEDGRLWVRFSGYENGEDHTEYEHIGERVE